MDDDKQQFFLLTAEIRFMMMMLSRISARPVEGNINSPHADLSVLQFGILHSLSHEGATLSELSRKFALDPSTLVPVIDTLERKGLVARGKDPNDRRRIPLSLTEQGMARIRRVPVFHEDNVLYKSLDEMGAEKAEALRALLREMVSKMPEGEEMLNAVTTRMCALQNAENVTQRLENAIHQQEDTHQRRHHRPYTNRQRNRRRERSRE